MSTEAWLLLLVWNSAYGRSCAETTHFLHLVQVNLPEIHYFSLFISLFITLTYVLIPNILAKTSSPFFFIRVIVCCKCQDNAQCSVISNCVYKLFSSKENRVKKNEGTFSDQSGDAMYAFIYFNKYKNSYWLVFFKIAVLKIFEENQEHTCDEVLC